MRILTHGIAFVSCGSYGRNAAGLQKCYRTIVMVLRVVLDPDSSTHAPLAIHFPVKGVGVHPRRIDAPVSKSSVTTVLSQYVIAGHFSKSPE